MKSKQIKVMAVTAILMAFNIVLSSFGVPVPGGHMYLNDVIICTAAILLNPFGAFMVGGVGVEIKKKRPQRTPLIAQLTRYASCPQVERLVVLAPRGVDLPKSIGGKPVTMMSLERLWGIMLP